MRMFTLTALATVLAASAAVSAQAQDCGTDCVVSPVEIHLDKDIYLNGTSGLKLSNVKVVAPEVEIPVIPPVSLDNAVELYQSNTGDISATKNLTTTGVAEVEASSTAIANVANIDVQGGLSLEGAQANSGDVMSTLNVTSTDAETANITATAIGNAVNATTTGDAIFDMRQTNSGDTISAMVDANIHGTGGVGEVNTAATAIANSFSINFDGSAIGSVAQENCADVIASNTDTINVWRDPATATAIGNAINITKTASK
ncbi:MAG: hypothetical protein H6851_15900 [Geminicoccaceae bacterium]|nr:hypothetical protein [Geminicoccaceae bacterium]